MAAERWEYGWQWRGACRGRDANLFFPPSHLERAEVKRERERTAKAICADVPRAGGVPRLLAAHP